jgi:3-oxoacyl-[acyl-carrier-protein] synthase II
LETDVVVTARGVVSPWGNDFAAFATGLSAGRCAVGDLKDSAAGRIAAVVTDFDASAVLPKTRGLREFDRTSLLLASATAEALADGALNPIGRDDVGMAVGTTFGTIGNIIHFDLDALREGPLYVSPLAFPNTVLNAPAGRLAGLFGIRGVNATLSTGETSGLDALIYGTEWLRAGRARHLLAGSGFGLDPVLADEFPSVLGEGAAMFLLQPRAEATARAYARVAGFATAFLPRQYDAAAIAAATVAEALDVAGIRAAAIDAVVSGGRGPTHYPELESVVLNRIFGSRPPVHDFTEHLGDCLDASGGLAIAAALLTLEAGAHAVVVSAFSRVGNSAFVVLTTPEGSA